MDRLKKQLSDFYLNFTEGNFKENNNFIRIRDKIHSEMDAYKAKNQNASAVALKSQLHSIIAENFEPVIFDELPFFYEMGIKPADNWGAPFEGVPSTYNLSQTLNNIEKIDKDLNSLNLSENTLSFCTGKVFDTDHHCIGYTTLFSVGLKGVIKNIRNRLSGETNEEKIDFLKSAEKSCLAVLKIAEKFAYKAEELYNKCEDANKKNNLKRIIDTAKRIPENPPESFFEGLCMIWFMREVTSSIEGVGVSLLGRVDKLLFPLYEKDIKSGIINRDEAKNLLKLWLTPTHIKFYADVSCWSDSSTVIELGGCDNDGTPIFNDITRLIIEAHEELNYVIPKLNCRIAKNSPKEYIDLISKSILRGRNVYSILNDDAIIEGLLNNGKSLIDARNYVNGGCQETMIEGMEHSAGALIYFNTPKIIEQSLCGVNGDIKNNITKNAMEYIPDKIEKPESFEEIYNIFLNNVKKAIKGSVELRVKYGKKWRDAHPCPLFSSTLEGCIENGMDYSAGGAKYNSSTFCMAGLGTVADSLYAIKKAVFEDKFVSYSELIKSLENDWNTTPELRAKMINLPKYGHNEIEVDSIAARFVKDINTYVKSLDNERGDKFILSTFVYGYYKSAGEYVGATPDGRKAKSCYSQGVTASRLRTPDSILSTVNSTYNVNFREMGGVSVLDINLPFNKKMNADIVSAIITTFLSGNCHSLQLNYISRDELIRAQKNPEKYKNLIVRMFGFSVYFVNLGKEFQDEFIARNFYES